MLRLWKHYYHSTIIILLLEFWHHVNCVYISQKCSSYIEIIRCAWKGRRLDTIPRQNVCILSKKKIANQFNFFPCSSKTLVQQKKNAWGWRFCVGIDRKEHGPKKTCYDIFRIITLTLATVHVIAEVILITFHIDKVELDELTVSIAYGIQHFLGLVKVYIM